MPINDYQTCLARLEQALSEYHDPVLPEQLPTLAALWTARQVVKGYTPETSKLGSVAASKPDTGSLKRMVDRLVYVLVKVEAFDQARQLIDLIEPPNAEANPRALALQRLVSGLARAEQFDEAQAVLALISGDDDDSYDSRMSAQFDLVCELADAEEFERAYKVAISMDGSGLRNMALYRLGHSLNEADDETAALVFQRLKQTALAIDDSVDRATTLYRWGGWGRGAGDHTDELLDLAWQTTLTIEQPFQRAKTLFELAKIWNKLGNSRSVEALDLARQTAMSIRDTIALAEGDDSRKAKNKYDNALALLSNIFLEDGQIGKAESVIASIDTSYKRCAALASLANKLIKTGQNDWLERSTALTRSSGEQDDVLSDVIPGLLWDDPERSQVDLAYQLVQKIGSPRHRVRPLRYLAGELCDMDDGRMEEVFSLARQAAFAIDTIYTYERENEIGELIQTLAECHRFQQAFETLATYDLPKFIIHLTDWVTRTDIFEELQPQLCLHVFQEVLRVASWAHPEWRPYYRLFAEAAN